MSETWRAPCLWRPLPASLAGGAGARPDYPINRPRLDLSSVAKFKTAATAISGRKSGSFERRRKVVPSVGNRTNAPRRVSSDKSIGGNVLGDYGTCRNNRVFAHRHSADDRCAGCDPYVSFNHDGLCDREGAPPRRFDGMAGRDDAHVRPDHHILGNVEPAKIIKSAVLIYENIAPDTDVAPAGCVDWWDQ